MSDQISTIAPVIRDTFACLPSALAGAGVQPNRVMLVGDSNTMPLYGEETERILKEYFREVHTYVFPAGEEEKQLRTIVPLLKNMMGLHFDRGDVIAALGGGVTGDMAGFAASVYLRGIPVIQLPTTLLAQIDSSIGGKTGVDLDGFKNMVGAFHMPSLVYTNPSVLATLPEEQFTAGMGEVIKSALLSDGLFFDWLIGHAEAILLRNPAVLLEMIERTARIKVDIVRRDPTEQGERALLNLGHTVGHAIEKAEQFRMLHGHCVAVGLIAAAWLSRQRGLIGSADYERIRSACALFGLPVQVSGLDADELLAITKSDKKMRSGKIRFILLRSVGEAFYSDDVSDDELLGAIRSVIGKEAD